MLLLWGGSLTVIGLVISLSPGIIHPYYTLAMTPSLGAVVGISVTGLWRRRRLLAARVGLAAGLGATVVWSYVLLGRTPDWFPFLRPAVVTVGALVAVAILTLPVRRAGPQLVLSLVAGVGFMVALAAPLLSTLATAASPQTGPIPVVTPDGSGGLDGILSSGVQELLARCSSSGAASGNVGTLRGVSAGNAFCREAQLALTSNPVSADATRSNPALTKLLEGDADRYSWVAATVGSIDAASYQLATRDPVMAIGGFHESDPVPTLAQFENYVSRHRIHYFIVSNRSSVGSIAGSGSQSDTSRIASWVESKFTHKIMGGVQVYDLASARSS